MDSQPNNLPRPTTATRPQTASRPKTAGRSNAERPPISAMSFERPVSRRLTTANREPEPVTPNEIQPTTTEVSHAIAPSATPFSFRTSSRSGTASSNIPRQTMTSSIIPNGQLRPTTQQGFIAQRPQSRLATSSGRQIADKTYFMGLLNTQLNLLNKETDSLSAELGRAEKENQNLLIYEQRAEEQANEIKALQNELSDYNLIIDRQNTSASDIRDLEFEWLEEQKRASELNSTVEELFKERREAEEQCRQLEKQLEDVKRQNADFLSNLDSSIKDEYESAKEDAERLRRELDESQTELNQLNKTKEDLDFQLASSPLKQQAMYLQEQISDLEARKKALLEEMNNDESPEKQRQGLIEQINLNNTEILNIQQQINELNDQVSLAQEELREFENEYELIAGEKNERYRDLRIKERQLDDFLQTFDISKMENERNLGEHQVEILKLLRQISMNCQREEITVTELDESVMGVIRPNASAPELQELHVRLQEESITLDESESRLNAELESIRREQTQRNSETVNLADFEQLKEKTSNETRELVDQSSELGIKVSDREDECNRLSGELSSLVQKLSQSPHFPKLRELRRRLEIAEDERKELRTQLDTKLAEVDYQNLKVETIRLRTEFNQLLIETLSR